MDTLDAGSDAPGRPFRPPRADAAGAVTALYQAHAVGMIRIALLMLGDRSAAEDVLYSLEMRSVNVTAAGGDLMADSRVVVSLGRDHDSTGLCGTVFPLVSGNGTTVFCVRPGGPEGHTNPTTVRWQLDWVPSQTDLADNAEWRFFPYIKTIGVPAGSALYPGTVWSSSTGATLLVEWTVVAPGSGGTSVRLGELALGHNQWTFTPLPAPAVFAAGGGLPGIAW